MAMRQTDVVIDESVRHDPNDEGVKVYAIIVEWDGVKPPSKYYRRLKEVAGLRVRDTVVKGKTDSPSLLAQRMATDGVIAQEGAIFVSKYSVARALAGFISNGIEVAGKEGTKVYRPASVFVAESHIFSFTMSEADRMVLKGIETRFSKRGRPQTTAIEGSWVLTCYEEMISYEIEGARPHSQCPHCGGYQVSVRPGKTIQVSDPGGDVLDAWIATRFQSGHWEPADLVGHAPTAPAVTKFSNDSESGVVAALRDSLLVEQVNVAGLSRERAFQVFDAALVQRVWWDQERANSTRTSATVVYLQSWQGAPILDGINFAATTDIDAFDCAGILGEGFASSLAKYWQVKRAGLEGESDNLLMALSVDKLSKMAGKSLVS